MLSYLLLYIHTYIDTKRNHFTLIFEPVKYVDVGEEKKRKTQLQHKIRRLGAPPHELHGVRPIITNDRSPKICKFLNQPFLKACALNVIETAC